jgi:hypothetical protein
MKNDDPKFQGAIKVEIILERLFLESCDNYGILSILKIIPN